MQGIILFFLKKIYAYYISSIWTYIYILQRSLQGVINQGCFTPITIIKESSWSASLQELKKGENTLICPQDDHVMAVAGMIIDQLPW